MRRKKILCNILILGFLLGVYEGKVALWKGNDPKPMKVFPYQASLLPEADRQALEKGIQVDSLWQLKQMIQDYLS